MFFVEFLFSRVTYFKLGYICFEYVQSPLSKANCVNPIPPILLHHLEVVFLNELQDQLLGDNPATRFFRGKSVRKLEVFFGGVFAGDVFGWCGFDFFWVGVWGMGG